MNTRLETRVGIYVPVKDAETGEESRTVKVITEAQYEKQKKAAEEKGQPEPEVKVVQTFSRPGIETLEDAQNAGLSPERINQLIARSWDIAETDAMRDILSGADFDGIDGAYDLLKDCSEVTERRKASPVDKAKKALDGLTDADAARLIEMLQARLATQGV